MRDKPALLLDVDGVLCPFGCDDDAGFSILWLDDGGWVWTDPAHVSRLERLGREFELIWATAWEHHANELIAPHYSLPTLKVIEFDLPVPGVEDLRMSDFKGSPWAVRLPQGILSWKLPWIMRWAMEWDGPWAWVDDDIGGDVDRWVKEYPHPALPLPINPVRGLTDDHVERLLRFAADLKGEERGAA